MIRFMLILAIDTSGKNGSVGLFGYNVSDAGVGSAGYIEHLTGGSYSAELVPKITDLLKRSNHTKSDIDGFVVASGPGSFTGLRVGLSTVKALADVLNKPIAAVSVLEAVARLSMSGAQERLLVALDAGRKQVYLAEFSDGRNCTLISERLLDLSTFVDEFRTGSNPVVTTDPSIAEAFQPTGRDIKLVPHPMANHYAVIGAERILAGNTISPSQLDANYIRRSDAEIFFKR